jgi:hypothetical protein
MWLAIILGRRQKSLLRSSLTARGEYVSMECTGLPGLNLMSVVLFPQRQWFVW